MIKNRTLCDVARGLTHKRPNFDAIAEVFKSHPHFDPDRAFNLAFYAWKASTIATRVNMAEITQDMPVEDDVLQSGDHGSYEIEIDSAGNIFGRKNSWYIWMPYDQVLKIDGAPLVVRNKLSQRGSGSNNGATLNKLLTGHKEYLAPIRTALKSDVAYMPVIPADVARNTRRTEPAENFREKKGMVIPMYTSKTGFEHDVVRMISRHNLAYKQ